ncbi:MAG: PKD domain-containing protein [Proteiniphilum sp.]|jgi:hypothetical protein|nr:PKD domain-containing protein [Proteiniphilum sp.]
MKTSIKNLILLSFFLSISFLIGCREERDNIGEVEEPQYSAYLTRVFEYTPAPGQFVNKLPEYAAGDTPASMAAKAEVAIAGGKEGLITLGGYGGYVVVGFDHTIENKSGRADFVVFGNAYNGNSEPGIVMVSVDSNKNGMPDDTWYELAGSEYNNAESIHNYAITYYRPDENKTPVPHSSLSYVTDATYIGWNAGEHGEGFIYKLEFHQQSYYPQWINQPELKFTGTRLPDNVTSTEGIYLLQSYEWGYADNVANNDSRAQLDIDWAVDAAGNKANLTGIDFVKIYTGVNQFNGRIGESSTEVSGVADLHLLQK